MEDEVTERSVNLTVPAEAEGERLDRYLPGALDSIGHSISRAALQSLIKSGDVLVDGVVVKPRYAVGEGESIEVRFPAPVSARPEAQEIEIRVIYEDDDIIVVDKQAGLVVHPASGNLDGTLVNALLHHCKGMLCELAGEDRPGIVHRLDKDTSGCLVAAKSEVAYRSLVSQFSDRETGKEYLAVTHGVPGNPEGTISNRIGRHPVNRQKMAVVDPPAGKEAITHYEVLATEMNGMWAVLKCLIHTGRTHQIRVHLKESLHCAILGDVIYGQPSRQKVKVDRLMLHARLLRIRHPSTGAELEFEAAIPPAFASFVETGS